MRHSLSPSRAAIGGEKPVSVAPFSLTEKEREVLRLLTRGHDAKSAAAALGLSVHTINERLREARTKTQTSSSRGAARLLAAAEDPLFLGPQEFGVTERVPPTDERRRLPLGAADGSRILSRWGIPMLVSALAAAAIVAASHSSADRPLPTAAPRVVATSPATDAVVEPGPLVLSVTFDRPMRRQSYSFVRKDAATYPDCGANRPMQSADGRTFTMRCRTQGGHRYEVWFNSPPYANFKSEDGAAAVPYGLTFRTR